MDRIQISRVEASAEVLDGNCGVLDARRLAVDREPPKVLLGCRREWMSDIGLRISGDESSRVSAGAEELVSELFSSDALLPPPTHLVLKRDVPTRIPLEF